MWVVVVVVVVVAVVVGGGGGGGGGGVVVVAAAAVLLFLFVVGFVLVLNSESHKRSNGDNANLAITLTSKFLRALAPA